MIFETLYKYMESIKVPAFIVREVWEQKYFIKDPAAMLKWSYGQFMVWYTQE